MESATATFLQAEIITDIRPIDLSNVQRVTDKLLAKGGNMIILTLGSLGAVYASKANRNVTHIPVAKVDPVDTTVRIVVRIIVRSLEKYL
jgi:sugar/nucleoside kinase (ribokinase family)